MLPITKLQLIAFRGAAKPFEIEFDPDKNFTLIFGENGTGKSTLIDAIDVVCNESIGCLEDISLGANAGKFMCTVGEHPATLKIIIESNRKKWTGELQRNNISIKGDGNRPIVKVLRRSKVLELITAQPKDRYQALARYLDVDVVEKSEASLLQAVKSCKKTWDEKTRQLSDAMENLNRLWETEGRPGPGSNSIEWAKIQARTGIEELRNSFERLRSATIQLAALKIEQETYLQAKAAHDEAMATLDKVNRAIEAAPILTNKSAIQLLEALEKARTFVAADEGLTSCPTCLRPIERSTLIQTIDIEIAGLSSLKVLNDERKKATRLFESSSESLVKSQVSFIKKCELIDSLVPPDVWSKLLKSDSNLVQPWPQNIRIGDAVILATHVTSHLQSLSADRDNASKTVSQFNTLNQQSNDLDRMQQEVAGLKNLHEKLLRAHDVTHQERVKFTQGILDNIRDEANRLYQSIHPGEQIGLSSLIMQEGKSGSVDQTSKFHGHEKIPPQAVFSESHLDTLGFCVWLALAKRDEPENSVLLIDDIFSSVDATHLRRIIDLICDESKLFRQVIVATHYRLWMERCQTIADVQRIQLGRWTLLGGMSGRQGSGILDELRAHLKDPILDRQAVASRSGILLESVLDDITMRFQLNMPRNKRNEYTLGPLLDTCLKFAEKVLKIHVNKNWQNPGTEAKWEERKVAFCFMRIKKIQSIRNQVGCHFNLVGLEICDEDVREFADATVDLVDTLSCPKCGSACTKIANDKTHMRCSCIEGPIKSTPINISNVVTTEV